MSSFDPLDLRGQEQARDEAATRDRLAKTNEDEDFKWLMGSKRGRRIVWRLLERTGVFRLSFNTNSMAMAFAEGNRNEGLRVLGQIHTLCPELYSVMMKEAIQ
jgi:hypothetical protein